jgi:1,2-diacylglycerol 3-beta-glucosyltransferase
VTNLSAMDYPAALRRILVVADNCSDATADRAREAGATVLVRHDTEKRGKGFALAHAFERSLSDGFADAVVVVDADTEVSPHLLHSFGLRLEAGAHAVQAHYGVMNPNASWRTRLMTIALALFHKVRSLGRERLGVSCGLRGNGMCFTHSVIRQVPHDAFSIVEDLEYGIRLGRAGHRVHYAWEAEVLGEMVSSEKAARSQRRRWEGGRWAMTKQFGVPLLGEALRKRDGVLLDLAMDLLVPPLSYVVLGAVGLSVASGVLSLMGGWAPLSAAAGAFCVGSLGLYVLRGWWVSGMGARGLLDLMAAPFYVVWKVWLMVAGPRDKKGEWVRTTREARKP